MQTRTPLLPCDRIPVQVQHQLLFALSILWVHEPPGSGWQYAVSDVAIGKESISACGMPDIPSVA